MHLKHLLTTRASFENSIQFISPLTDGGVGSFGFNYIYKLLIIK